MTENESLNEWRGEETCKFYKGIKHIKIKKCCGGKTVVRCKISCSKFRTVYQEGCVRDYCTFWKDKNEEG